MTQITFDPVLTREQFSQAQSEAELRASQMLSMVLDRYPKDLSEQEFRDIGFQSHCQHPEQSLMIGTYEQYLQLVELFNNPKGVTDADPLQQTDPAGPGVLE